MSIARVHGFLLTCFMKHTLIPINNRQNPPIFQNKKGIGSRLDHRYRASVTDWKLP